jgi:hypothetical protein
MQRQTGLIVGLIAGLGILGSTGHSWGQAPLPTSVMTFVRQDLSRRLAVPPTQFRILDAQPQTWPDGCLGLAQPTEVCTRALVPGWRVRVTQGEQVWVYRTNQTGSRLRLENPDRPSVLLPGNIAQSVLADATRRSALNPRSLNITTADRRNWSDSCLGLGALDLCTEVIVPGWQVVIESNLQRWVYRTDLTGNLIRLDLAASRVVGRLIQAPTQIPVGELPPPLAEGISFRLVSQGGLLNRRTETWLTRDGQIFQARPDGNGDIETKRVRQLKPEALTAFEQLLQQRQFSRFNQIDYLPPQGAVNISRVVVSVPSVTVRFADSSQAQLPEDLQQVLRGWDNLVQTGQITTNLRSAQP